ncbi:MAG: helix-turn-helix domain-containing protein [Pyrinomonadaceae bacterium]|nr:helix-turn-helix domain-containing protein [Pyrinomonadaceae bacterium]
MDIKNSDQQPEGQAADAGSSGDDGGSSSLGAHLRRAREARGYTLRDLEDRTRISRRYLEAIELNDYKQLPGGIFNRSFVKAFAREVGIGEQEALKAYAQTAREQGESTEDIPPSREQSRVYSNVDSSRSPLITLLLSVFILAILTLGVYAGLHYYQRRQQTPQAAQPANAPPPPPAATGTAAVSVPTAASPANAGGLNIQVKAKGEAVWLRTRVDEEPSTDGTLAVDQVKEFSAHDRVKIEFAKSRATALEVTVNGRPVAVPTDAKGKSLVEFLITKNDYGQLPQ